MKPLLNTQRQRAADQHTVGSKGITSLRLMEQAALAAAQELLEHEDRLVPNPSLARYLVVCGPGNNGGDGLAMARLLSGCGRAVQVVLGAGEPRTDEAKVMLERLRTGAAVPILDRDAVDLSDPAISGRTIVVDALFGLGLDRALTGTALTTVHWMNASGLPVVSIDLPSGLRADGLIHEARSIVQADLTIGLHCPKPAFVLRECAPYIGRSVVVPIGLDDEYIDSINSEYQLIEHQDIDVIEISWGRHAHKGDHGHAFLVAGAAGMIGAAVLSAKAAVRSGCGLVTAVAPGCAAGALGIQVPEALCIADQEPEHLFRLPDLSKATALGIGPGLGRRSDNVVKSAIQEARMPLIMDADALNAMADNKTWLAFLAPGTVLTPHPKEFDRLFGAHSTSRERIETARSEARKRGLVIVLKGAYTAICSPDGKVYFNPTGDPGMAKGGSGDVLTGLLAGLLARGLQPLAAALLGVWVHGRAGSLAAATRSREGMTAMDTADHLPNAWQELRQPRS